jgi:hypothetical protein
MERNTLPKYYNLMTPAENPCETPVRFYTTYKLLRPGICYFNATKLRMGGGGRVIFYGIETRKVESG